MKTILYFAYGSNLDRQQMRRRCPDARKLSSATLSGYRIAFGGYSRMWGGPVATIKKNEKARTDGVLYKLSSSDLKALDFFEGHPVAYKRQRMTVIDRLGKKRRAYVYVKPITTEKRPASAYIRTILFAYVKLGFDTHQLALSWGGVK